MNKNISYNVNQARMSLKNVGLLEREDIVKILAASGFPKGNDMVSQCIKFGIIEKRGNNKYAFPNKPIYYQKIGNAIDACRKHRNANSALYRARIKRDVEYSADFLQKHGYKVIGVK